MSSSNSLTSLNPSQLMPAVPFADNGGAGLGAGQTTMYRNGQGNTYFRNTAVQMKAGQARDVGVTVIIRNAYPARYNFAVNQYNYLPDQGTSRYCCWSTGDI